MKKNVGHPIDIGARIIVGLLLLSLIFFVEGNARWAGLIGIIPMLTAFIGWCPTWAVCGISTVKKNGG